MSHQPEYCLDLTFEARIFPLPCQTRVFDGPDMYRVATLLHGRPTHECRTATERAHRHRRMPHRTIRGLAQRTPCHYPRDRLPEGVRQALRRSLRKEKNLTLHRCHRHCPMCMRRQGYQSRPSHLSPPATRPCRQQRRRLRSHNAAIQSACQCVSIGQSCKHQSTPCACPRERNSHPLPLA